MFSLILSLFLFFNSVIFLLSSLVATTSVRIFKLKDPAFSFGVVQFLILLSNCVCYTCFCFMLTNLHYLFYYPFDDASWEHFIDG